MTTTLPFETRVEFTSLLNSCIEGYNRRLRCDYVFWQPNLDYTQGRWWYNYWSRHTIKASLFYEEDQAVISMNFILSGQQLKVRLGHTDSRYMETNACGLALAYFSKILWWESQCLEQMKNTLSFNWSEEGF